MRLHGVDFSGASDGGSGGIRVAERELGNPHPISAVRRMHRAGLRQAILDSREDGEQHFWLIDAPFGVARETLEACESALHGGKPPIGSPEVGIPVSGEGRYEHTPARKFDEPLIGWLGRPWRR